LTTSYARDVAGGLPDRAAYVGWRLGGATLDLGREQFERAFKTIELPGHTQQRTVASAPDALDDPAHAAIERAIGVRR